jgi:hydroxymethylbilane synthase
LIKRKIKIGTRGSDLALWQANWAKNSLESQKSGYIFEIEILKTKGDNITDVSLSKIGDKGLFTKEIEQSLINGDIDMAVHSLKDLPTALPEGLKIGAYSQRAERRDVLLSKKYDSLDDIPLHGRIGTGSLRRKAQLLNYRNDLDIIEIRGNISTRIQKLEDLNLDGIILAYAGISRLGLEEYLKQIIDENIILPAVSQGIIAVEIRNSDKELSELAGSISNKNSELEALAERAFLRELEGGCQVPIGIYSAVNNDNLVLEGMVAAVDGSKIIRDIVAGNFSEPEKTGILLAEKLKKQGAVEVLQLIRRS